MPRNENRALRFVHNKARIHEPLSRDLSPSKVPTQNTNGTKRTCSIFVTVLFRNEIKRPNGFGINSAMLESISTTKVVSWVNMYHIRQNSPNAVEGTRQPCRLILSAAFVLCENRRVPCLTCSFIVRVQQSTLYLAIIIWLISDM